MHGAEAMRNPNFRYYMERKVHRGSDEPSLHILPPKAYETWLKHKLEPCSPEDMSRYRLADTQQASISEGAGAFAYLQPLQALNSASFVPQGPQLWSHGCSNLLQPHRGGSKQCQR